MAYSLAFKRLVASNIFPKSVLSTIRPVATVPSTSRLFNTNAIRNFDDHDDERGLDADRRSDGSVSRRRGDFLSDVFDPFFPTTSLSQVLGLMDQFMDNPFLNASRGNIGRRGWEAKETDDALHLRIDMPGLGKEDVKVFVEQNTLVIKGEGEKESDEEESGRRYTSRIVLPEKVYKTNEIKAEIKNGVLKVVVPKVKEEERAHVVHVNVD